VLQEGESTKIPVSWLFAPGQLIPSGQTALVLTGKALQNCRVSDAISLSSNELQPEIYDVQKGRRPLEMQAYTAFPSANLNIAPNPASDAFDIRFESENEGDVLIELVDFQGRMALANRVHVVKGMNQFQIRRAQLLDGLYALRIDGKGLGKVMLH
jgi:hypothetical protein